MAKNNNPGRILKGTKSQPSLKGASGVWTLDEALQYHRANQWPQPNLYQPIPNSLRFKAASTSNLSWTPSRPGNSKKFTLSCWVKREQNSISGENDLLSATIGGSPRDFIGFAGSTSGTLTDSITVGFNQTGSSWVFAYTNAAYRDSSAWYHVVVAVDTVQSTAANRVLIYVNGVLQSMNASSTYPAQGSSVTINSANFHTIGKFAPNNTGTFDGQLSEYYFIDGYALQPTLFGQFDSNNVWVPIPYTGSYGTNGFYLPFTNATTSQTLGYDASLNGTTTYGADQDPYRGSVVLHLDGNGPAGGQNNTFADSSTNNLRVTVNGTVGQGSFSPFPLPANSSYNPAISGGSMASNTSGSLSVPYGSWFTGAATIEFWFYTNSTNTLQGIFGGGVDVYGINLEFNEPSGQHLQLFIGNGSWAGGGYGYTSAATLNTNTWYHIAYVKTSGTTANHYLYINGVVDANINGVSATFSWSGSTFYVGVPQITTRYMSGNISSFAIYTTQKYTSNFVPMQKPTGTLTNNYVMFSEDTTNYRWNSNTNITTTLGATIAPDGTPTGNLITATSTAASYLRQDTGSNMGTSTVYTMSAYVKAATSNVVTLSDGYGTGANVTYNLSTQTQTTISGGGYGTPSSTITGVGNGWYRINLTFTTQSATSYQIGTRIDPGRTYGGTGNVGDSVYVWGLQLELGSSMTNYTPTPANFSTAPSLLLNFTNAAIVDSTGANNLTTVANATISSSSKYGSGALVLNYSGTTTSDWLAISNGPTLFNFGTGNWTIEAWIYPTVITADQYVISIGGTGVTAHWGINIYQSGWRVGSFNSYEITLTASTNLLNTWSHVALVVNNGCMIFFINGQNVGQLSVSGVPFNCSGIARVGQYYAASSGNTWSGLIDDLRVTNGVARYQANFTPPSRALPEIGGKSFVTNNINAGVVKSFTTVGTTSWTAPTDVTQIEVLVVAGGGGGGPHQSNDKGGAGGGAGGLIYSNNYPVTPGQTYTVTVGAGGAGGVAGTNSPGSNGSNSIFGNLIAIGGGGGAQGYAGGPFAGQNGGSGGGGTADGSGNDGNPGSGTPGQGFSSSANTGTNNCAGGGGAGGVGTGATGSTGGNGGPGLQFGISGTATYYAGGGGGAAYSGTSGSGGSGSGGNAGAQGSNSAGSPGVANTGGGGGGAGSGSSSTAGGAGGSGVVIVRYTTSAVANSSDSTTDNLLDSPTLYGHDLGNGGEVVGNYATYSPLLHNPNITPTNGNLTITANTGSWRAIGSTIFMSTGSWYAEITVNTIGDGVFGLCSLADSTGSIVWTDNNFPGRSGTTGVGYYTHTGQKVSASATSSYASALVAGDVLGCAFNADAGTVVYYKNGLSLGTAFTGLSGSYCYFSAVETGGAGTTQHSINFGQRPWAYTPPQGFSALTTKNLPRPTGAAASPNQYFDAVTYTGNGVNSANALTVSGLNFQPDLIWIKNRTSVTDHWIQDTVRGLGYALNSDTTSADLSTGGGDVSSVNSTGFIVSYNNTRTNKSGDSYVAWCWRANGAAVSNTSGTITSQVSANTTSGFSIVTYTGTGANGATIGHGLTTTAPSFIMIKSRSNGTNNWFVYHSSLYALNTGNFIYLNTTAAVQTGGIFFYTAPTTSVFSVGGTGNYVNETGLTYVAYCWSPVPGFSAFGSYTGNGLNDGPFIYTGFKPKYVMIKCTSTTDSWVIEDGVRDTYNPDIHYLLADSSVAEGSGAGALRDLLSNGFKVRNSGNQNAANATYIYAAFAANPFGNANGTAR
jgi:Concanavalin A-like lectin/glucanases superfamily/SPRY domain